MVAPPVEEEDCDMYSPNRLCATFLLVVIAFVVSGPVSGQRRDRDNGENSKDAKAPREKKQKEKEALQEIERAAWEKYRARGVSREEVSRAVQEAYREAMRRGQPAEVSY